MPGDRQAYPWDTEGRILARAWDKASNLAPGCKHGQRLHGQRLHQRTEVRWPQSGIPTMRDAGEYSSHILLLIRCIPRACSLVVRLRCLCKGQNPTLDPATAPPRKDPQMGEFWTLRYSVAGAFKSPA